MARGKTHQGNREREEGVHTQKKERKSAHLFNQVCVMMPWLIFQIG